MRNEGAIVTWFYKIVLHECYALLKAKKRIVLTENRSYWEISYDEYSSASEPPFYRLRATSDFNTLEPPQTQDIVMEP